MSCGSWFLCYYSIFSPCFGAGRSLNISPRRSPTSCVAASKLLGCLNSCYFNWIAFSFGSAPLHGVTVLCEGCQPDSHPHSGSRHLSTHSGVLLLCWSALSLWKMDPGGSLPHLTGLHALPNLFVEHPLIMLDENIIWDLFFCCPTDCSCMQRGSHWCQCWWALAEGSSHLQVPSSFQAVPFCISSVQRHHQGPFQHPPALSNHLITC